MASAATTGAAALLLFSFSAILLFLFLLLLLQAPPAAAPRIAVADLVVSALDRVLLHGRGLWELATRRNMVLICHAILLLLLRDAGVLGAPARRRCRTRSLGESTAAVGTEIACSATAAPAARQTHATRREVVWRRRRPRNRAVAPVHKREDAAGRVVGVECRPAVEAVVAATWAAAAAVASKQIVLVETPRNDDDDLLHHRHDRDAVFEPVDHPIETASDGERDDGCDDRRIIPVADDEAAREQQTPGMELADDRTIEEFIERQRRKMRQESLQLVSSSGYHYQATIATCY